MKWLFGLIGLLIGGICIYILCRVLPQEKIRKLNEDVIEQEQLILQDLSAEEIKLRSKAAEAEQDLAVLETKKEEAKEFVESYRASAAKAGEQYYNQEMELAKERVKNSLQDVEKNYKEGEEECKAEYETVIQDLLERANQAMQTSQDALLNLADIQSKVSSAVEALKRAELERTQKDFYRLNLTDIDVEEISKIRSIEPYLRDKEPLNKVIWKVYYEKPYTDLVGRVVGSKAKTGIYKITNIENGMCYVGQAVNIAERWKQHIKRGVGAEQPTRNKLYPAMLAIGVENFTFEIVEECPATKLNDREDYWQDFFKAKEFGYSIK